ncbi:hypothetical protein HMI01_01130 [Halolactibacillus miurensis]|uniref:Uncharacterized protein n=1 Tax=Halolactibacillus miurensis TaxID=306541 RepID=A0A1I6P4F4_9BACI|nr:MULTISPECIES: hypothetical protein [Halolactibacillus]GEM03125.1 hypothetical protein HMI01_01130 [Halolactibacillus miurensis]SFS35083.1 hypothetical protein SAMN05421668_101195 [Halolactibacillus miurensis]
MEENKTKIFLAIKAVLFVVFIAMVIIGQRTIGHMYLLMQLVGLTGLLVLLWNYNRKYL